MIQFSPAIQGQGQGERRGKGGEPEGEGGRTREGKGEEPGRGSGGEGGKRGEGKAATAGYTLHVYKQPLPPTSTYVRARRDFRIRVGCAMSALQIHFDLLGSAVARERKMLFMLLLLLVLLVLLLLCLR